MLVLARFKRQAVVIDGRPSIVASLTLPMRGHQASLEVESTQERALTSIAILLYFRLSEITSAQAALAI